VGPVLLPLSYTGSVCAEEVGFEPTTGACLYAASNGGSVAAGSSRAAHRVPPAGLEPAPSTFALSRALHCAMGAWSRAMTTRIRASGRARTGSARVRDACTTRRAALALLLIAPSGRYELGSVVRGAAGQTRTGHLGRTRTVLCLLSYDGVGAAGGGRTRTGPTLNRVPLPLGYRGNAGPTGRPGPDFHPLWSFQSTDAAAADASTGGRSRTHTGRVWKPPLCQLSYTRMRSCCLETERRPIPVPGGRRSRALRMRLRPPPALGSGRGHHTALRVPLRMCGVPQHVGAPWPKFGAASNHGMGRRSRATIYFATGAAARLVSRPERQSISTRSPRRALWLRIVTRRARTTACVGPGCWCLLLDWLRLRLWRTTRTTNW
jgi:hypothetical protein